MMVQLSDELIQGWQQSFKEMCGKEVSRQEAQEWAFNLIQYFELLVEIDRKYGKLIQGNKKGLEITQ